MVFKYFDRVKETSATTGTGAISLGGAATGYQAFNSVYNNGDTFCYCIIDQSGANWETGIGTYVSSGNQMARTKVMESNNNNNLVNFTSGALFVFVNDIAYWLNNLPVSLANYTYFGGF